MRLASEYEAGVADVDARVASLVEWLARSYGQMHRHSTGRPTRHKDITTSLIE